MNKQELCEQTNNATTEILLTNNRNNYTRKYIQLNYTLTHAS